MKNTFLNFLLLALAVTIISCEKEVNPKYLPEVSTTEVSSISYYSAQSGGVITADGGYDVISRGVCWSLSPNPTVIDSKTIDAAGTGEFKSLIENLTPGTLYYVRAYATNKDGTAYGLQRIFTTQSLMLPSLTTNNIVDIGVEKAKSGGDIYDDGGAQIITRGVCWSTSPNPTAQLNTKTVNGNGKGKYESILDELQPNTKYFVRAYASNSVGTSYGQEFYLNTYGVVTNPISKQTWLDRNLGASRVANSQNDSAAYGDLYQWGRDTDGHEKRTSQTTSILSSNDIPDNGYFIIVNSEVNDWRNPQNNNLWQGKEGINNPCPEGFRIPTADEWAAEQVTWNRNNAQGGIESVLKLPSAGSRYNVDGWVNNNGSTGGYWSSTNDGNGSQIFFFHKSYANIVKQFRSYGLSVRCIKD